MTAAKRQTAFVGAREAAALLGVQRATIYAYASRGLIRSRATDSGRKRMYDVRDLERLKVRRDARRGHAPTAAGALMFGQPVLTSSVCEVTARGPTYRGESAVELVRRRVEFERVAELLWTGRLPERSRFFTRSAPPRQYGRVAAMLPKDVNVASLLAAVLPVLGAADPYRHGATEEAEWQRAGTLIRALAESLALKKWSESQGKSGEQTSVAGALLVSLGVTPKPSCPSARRPSPGRDRRTRAQRVDVCGPDSGRCGRRSVRVSVRRSGDAVRAASWRDERAGRSAPGRAEPERVRRDSPPASGGPWRSVSGFWARAVSGRGSEGDVATGSLPDLLEAPRLRCARPSGGGDASRRSSATERRFGSRGGASRAELATRLRDCFVRYRALRWLGRTRP